MTPALRRLLAHDLRQQAPYLALGPVFALSACWPLILGDRYHVLARLDLLPYVPIVVLMVTLGGETAVWRRGLQGMRSRLLLPLSRRALGQAEWWLTLGLPGVVLSLSLVGVLLARAFDGVPSPHAKEIGAALLFAWGGAGYVAAARVGARHARQSRRYHVLAPILGGLALSPLFAPLGALELGVLSGEDVSHALLLDEYIGVAGFGLLAAVYLFGRPELLLASPQPTARRKEARSARARRHRPAWGVLAGRFGAQLVALTAAGAAVTLMPGDLGVLVLAPLVLMCVSSFMTLPLLSAMRALRTLPLTADRLAAQLSSLMLVSIQVMFLAIDIPREALHPAGTLWPGSTPADLALPFVPILIVSLSCASLLPPLALRFGLHGAGAATAVQVLVTLGCARLSTWHDLTVTSVPLLLAALALAGAVAVTSHLWTRHELCSGRHAYRRALLASLISSGPPRSDAP